MSDPYNRNIQSIVIHHPGDGLPPEISITKRWNPFSYQFPEYDYGIESYGEIKIGRPLDYQGAHCIATIEPYVSRGNQWFNQNSIGIAVAGDFTKYQMSRVQLLGLVGLVQKLMKQYNIPISEVFMHKQVTSTDCPGNWNYDEFYALVQGNVVSPPSPTTKPLLKLGSQGSDVITLQTLLTDKGYNPNGIDGDFGNGTKNAVIAFQRNNSLVADGIVGVATWNKLLSSPVVKPSITIPTSILRFGDKGSDVKILQDALNAKGFDCGYADSDFGNMTKNAVLKFQAKNGLVQDSLVGGCTWKSLLN